MWRFITTVSGAEIVAGLVATGTVAIGAGELATALRSCCHRYVQAYRTELARDKQATLEELYELDGQLFRAGSDMHETQEKLDRIKTHVVRAQQKRRVAQDRLDALFNQSMFIEQATRAEKELLAEKTIQAELLARRGKEV